MADITADIHSRCWFCLPTELKDMILERCTWNTRWEDHMLAGSHPLAMLATVCRDWEEFFAGKLFRRLTLKTETDVQTFANLVQGRRKAYVEWIWLRVELPMYGCQQCHRLETREDSKVQMHIFTNLVWNLFDVLSEWKGNEAGGGGITLELSAHSPSDAHHFNKDLRFRIHDTAWDRWDNRAVTPHNDPFHGWRRGKQVKKIPVEAKYRLFGPGLRFDYKLSIVRRLHMRLPKVSAVSSLVIRRQFPRSFAARKTLNTMFRSLTRLKNFSYEPWRGPTVAYQTKHDRQYAFLATEALTARRKTLKKVSIFESHDEIFYRPHNSITRQRRETNWFSCALARTSHQLEELYVAHSADAYEFLYAFRPQAPPAQSRWMAWNELKKLSLTARMLSPGSDDLVLLMAAKAAMVMPKLQIMELWNCWTSRGIAAIFRFRRGETEASVELFKVWPERFVISAATIAAWVSVARAHRPLPLRWEQRTWYAGVIDGEHSMLSRLALVEHMLNPVSLRQIAREDRRRREERGT